MCDNNNNKYFYKLHPLPDNNIIYQISRDGKMTKNEKNLF